MKKKLFLGIVLLGFVYIAWALLLKFLPVILVALGCYCGYRAINAVNKSSFRSGFKNLFLAYLFIIPGAITNGTLIVHWENFPKIFPLILK